MNSFWDKIYFGNTVLDWTISLGIILLTCLVARIIQSIVLKKMQKLAVKTSSTLDDFAISLLQRTIMPLIYILACYAGIQYVELPVRINNVLHTGIMIVIVFFIIRIIINILGYSFQRYTNAGDKEAAQVKQAMGILLIIKIVLWIIGFIFLLDNLGYDITTIVAGLGIGGIAIALAAQAVLADLFSYLVIFFDKPFGTGDFIVIGDKSGIVEYIGIKTTRLRTLGGEQLIMSNTDLTNSRVQNFKRMERRRVLFSIGVTYETSSEKLKRIPSVIKEIIDASEGVQFDRTHFSGFGDFSLNFEIVYYILSADYVQYMNSHQSVCLALFEKFEKEEIDFAYPTQKVFISGTTAVG